MVLQFPFNLGTVGGMELSQGDGIFWGCDPFVHQGNSGQTKPSMSGAAGDPPPGDRRLLHQRDDQPRRIYRAVMRPVSLQCTSLTYTEVSSVPCAGMDCKIDEKQT